MANQSTPLSFNSTSLTSDNLCSLSDSTVSLSKLTKEYDNETDYVPGVQNADSILLSEVFADTISNKVQANLSTGRISQFRLYHDGINVTAVGDF